MQKPLSTSELRRILDITNERDLFIVGHIYIENTIDRILEKRFNYHGSHLIQMLVHILISPKNSELTLEHLEALLV